MADENSDRRHWPKLNLNRKIIARHLRKVETATIRHTHKFIIRRWTNIREVQTKVMTWMIIMGLLILATGLQLMWFQRSYLTTAPARDGTYAEAVLGPIDTLNPIFSSSSAEQSVDYLIFSSLLRYDKTGHLNNDIATNVRVNDASTVYTVTIRPDAKWQDGVSLTAKDVVFTVNLLKNPNVRSTITGWSNISAKAINDSTVEFTLPSVYAAFEYALTFPILPEHILGNIAPGSIREANFSQNPIGSGPFKFKFIQDVSANSDQKVIYLTRNDQYYGGVAKLAQFKLNTYDTTDDIMNALSNNEVNAAADLSPVDINQVNLNRYIVSVEPVQSGVYAIINTKSALLSDITLRRALQLATNTDSIRSKLPSNTPSLDLPFTKGQLTGDVPSAPKFDLEAAKKMLDSDGWLVGSDNIRQKNGQELKLSIVAIKNDEFESVLDNLSTQWLAAGISVQTQIVDPNDASQSVVQNILQPRNFDVLIYRLNIGADPDVYAYWDSSQATPQGLNFSNYSNVISDDALASARVRVEPNLRNAKYITFAKQWLSDVPAIGLYQSTAQYVFRRNVHAVDSSSILVSATDRYNNILNWSIGSQTVYKTP
jgi:peptide/nickel transport system substrate-binding protein